MKKNVYFQKKRKKMSQVCKLWPPNKWIIKNPKPFIDVALPGFLLYTQVLVKSELPETGTLGGQRGFTNHYADLTIVRDHPEKFRT